MTHVINTKDITEKEYVNAILAIVDTDDEDIANRVNHQMLESKTIPAGYFRAAARALVNIIMAR